MIGMLNEKRGHIQTKLAESLYPEKFRLTQLDHDAVDLLRVR